MFLGQDKKDKDEFSITVALIRRKNQSHALEYYLFKSDLSFKSSSAFSVILAAPKSPTFVGIHHQSHLFNTKLSIVALKKAMFV